MCGPHRASMISILRRVRILAPKLLLAVRLLSDHTLRTIQLTPVNTFFPSGKTQREPGEVRCRRASLASHAGTSCARRSPAPSVRRLGGGSASPDGYNFVARARHVLPRDLAMLQGSVRQHCQLGRRISARARVRDGLKQSTVSPPPIYRDRSRSHRLPWRPYGTCIAACPYTPTALCCRRA